MQQHYVSKTNTKRELGRRRWLIVVGIIFIIFGAWASEIGECAIGCALIYFGFCKRIVSIGDKCINVCNDLLFTKLSVDYPYSRWTDIIIDTRETNALRMGLVKDKLTLYSWFNYEERDDILEYISKRNSAIKIKYLHRR